MRIPLRSFRSATAVLFAASFWFTATVALAQVNPPGDKPVLSAPANTDTLQTSELPVELTWSAVDAATTYEMQLFATGPAVDGIEPIQLKSKVITDPAYTLETAEILGLIDSLGTNTFWWRVRGRNIAGEGPWSNVDEDAWRFTILDPEPGGPEIAAIPDTTILETATFAYQVVASDPDGGVLTYALTPDTPGLGINADGLIEWMPTEDQGPDSYPVQVVVTDDQGESASEPFTITVLEVNEPPVLSVLDALGAVVADGDTKRLVQGSTLTLDANATDPDIPENTLVFSLDETAVSNGLTIDGSSGEFTFASAQAGLFPVTVFVNDQGEPNLSDSLTLTFLVDIIDEPLITPVPDTPDGACLINLSWIAERPAPLYIVEVATDSLFASPVLVDTVSVVSYAAESDQLDEDTMYFWRVLAYDPSTGNKSIATAPRKFSLWPASISLGHTLNFPKAEVSGDFRMVSIPGQSQAIGWASTFAGQAHESEWRVFRDDSDNEPYSGYLQQYNFDGNPSDPSYIFQPGKGFWAISNSAWNVPAQSVDNVSLNGQPAEKRSTFFSIPLNTGASEADAKWTMIGNPFDFPVSWSDILAANGLGNEDVLWYWVGTQYNNEPVMEPYKGYYFFNRLNLSELKMPCITRVAPAAAPKQEKLDRALTLSLVRNDEQGASYTASEVLLGIQKEASESVDALDRFIPPAFFEDYRLTVKGEQLETRYKYLQQEVRADIGEGQAYDILLRAKPDEPVLLKAEGLEAWMDTEVYLVDKTLGITYNLHDNSEIRLNPAEQDSRYQLLVGSSDYIAEVESELVPDAFRLQQNYPNPFTGKTQIEFALPDPGHVTLEVYNVLGQRVRTLVNDGVQAGYHSVAWDGRNDAGETAASGLYVYVLQTESQQASGRMVLLR